MKIRPYTPEDYLALIELYKQGDLYGGQYDPSRDSETRLQKKIDADPDAILVAEEDESIIGTVSLIEDGRVAWLFRFAVAHSDKESSVAEALYAEAIAILKSKNHTQVLIYSPTGNTALNKRYTQLGMSKGTDYTCFWQDI
jgi:predicted N-acetyltransferase YhbS